MNRYLLCAALAITYSPTACLATKMTMVEFTDIDMRPINWDVISKSNNVSFTDSSFVNTEALLVSGSGPFFAAIFRKEDNQPPVKTWDPATLGAIETVECSADFFIGPQGVIFAPVLVQGQNVYAPPGVSP